MKKLLSVLLLLPIALPMFSITKDELTNLTIKFLEKGQYIRFNSTSTNTNTFYPRDNVSDIQLYEDKMYYITLKNNDYLRITLEPKVEIKLDANSNIIIDDLRTKEDLNLGK